MTTKFAALARRLWPVGLSPMLDLARVPGLRRLSPSLRWALVGSSVATLGVLLLPEPQPDGVPANAGAGSLAVGMLPSTAAMSPGSAASAPAGGFWRAYVASTPPEFAEAERDPFAPDLPPAPPAPVPTLAAAPPPPPPPPLPTPQFSIVGWFGVEGQGPQVLLTNGQTEIVAREGLALPDGFVVQSVNAQRVVLRHAVTQTDYALSLPASLAESR